MLTALINTRMKDAQAAATLGNAVKNALGAMQQASSGAIEAAHPDVKLPGVTPAMAAGIQYVLDHAAEEALHFGISQKATAGKITAQLGLRAIDANVAAAGVLVPTPHPLDPTALPAKPI